MKIYIITYDGSTTIKKCLARYKELGYDPIIFMGKSIIKDKIKSNIICYKNYTNLLNSLDKTEDIIISEDDVWLNEKIDITTLENSGEINWIGYWNKTEKQILGSMLIYFPQKILQHLLNSIDKKDDIIISEDDAWIIKKINIINKDEINWLGYWKKTTKQTLGSMLIYYPQSKLQHVSRQFNAKQPQHLDSFINKYLDFIIRPTPITREIQHNSIILEQYSKGTKTIRTHKYML